MQNAQLQSDIPTKFRQAMFDAGIATEDTPIADSQLHRFKVGGDKNGSKNGWYVLFSDNNPKGCFGSWKLGTNDIWSLKNFREYTQQEKAEWAKQQAEAKKERDKAQALTHKEARAEANNLWSNAKPEIGNHKYLRDKGVQAYNIRSDGFKLLIPLRDTKGALHSLQTIDPTGKKLFLSGGAIKGNYFGIGKPKDKLIITEGYSTGASIHKATGYGVAIAFNAGNLLPVAKALREKFPDIEIIIAGDNDAWTEGNPGKREATEAAQAINGKLIIPEFVNTESKPTDFNDLQQLEGLEVVKKAFDEAQVVEEIQEGPIVNQTIIEKVEELAKLSNLEYEKVRKQEAKALDIRGSVLDKEVAKERKRLEEEDSDQNSIVSDVEEWPEAVQGNQLFSELKALYKQYAILPEGADTVLSFWTLGTYCFDAFRIYPMIGLTSPEKRCGKSTAMSLLKAFTNKSLLASCISPAAVYRVAELCKPTLLIDEADTFMKDNDELRGIINAGHTKDTANIVKCDGEQNKLKKFSTWTPKALAMIGDLPDTIKDRSIVISMRRKMPGETVTKIPLNAAEEFIDMRRKCKRWAVDNFDRLTNYVPTLPDHNNDREIDNWTPLFSIAGVCEQKQDVLDAMRSILLTVEDDSIKVVLLTDIKKIFDDKQYKEMHSEDLVNALIELDDRPWAEWKRGNPLTANSLARLLKPFKIRSRQLKIYGSNKNGYEYSAFKETFKCYIPPAPDQSSTPLQDNTGASFSDIQNSTNTGGVEFQKQPEPAPVKERREVEVGNRDIGGNEDNHVQVIL